MSDSLTSWIVEVHVLFVPVCVDSLGHPTDCFAKRIRVGTKKENLCFDAVD